MTSSREAARRLLAEEAHPAPPEGSQLVKFASSYESGAKQVESLSLVWEDGARKVAGMAIG